MVKIALDAYGGDNAPEEIVKGAMDCFEIADKGSIFIYFVGKQQGIEAELAKYPQAASYKEYYEIVNADTVIEMAENPVKKKKKKKDSSIVVALHLVKDKKADCYVSGGSTGASLAGGQLIIGKEKGVLRPPLAPLVPTVNGVSLLIDCGANVDARPEWLHQFAHMGSIYMESAMNIKNPKVGLLNIGTEEEKGNELTKAAYALLKDDKQINFIGNIEARDVNYGTCDVIVCDAFAGNVCLKTMEGAAGALQGALKKALMSSPKTKIGALLAKKAIKTELKKYDATNYGGAPMLGLKGLVVKIHGNAKAKEVKNALLQCITFHEQNVNGKIAERFAATSADE